MKATTLPDLIAWQGCFAGNQRRTKREVIRQYNFGSVILLNVNKILAHQSNRLLRQVTTIHSNHHHNEICYYSH